MRKAQTFLPNLQDGNTDPVKSFMLQLKLNAFKFVLELNRNCKEIAKLKFGPLCVQNVKHGTIFLETLLKKQTVKMATK